jgi:ribosomal protein S12 methylthiotransferase
LAQRYAGELAESLPEADGFFGNSDLSRVPLAAAAALGVSADGITAGSVSGEHAGTAPLPGERPLLSPPGSAYVKISEGCDNCCSFCAIPRIRGALRSRTIADIKNECERLLARGIRELCLIGQDLGSYGTDLSGAPSGSRLPELLEALSTLEGRFWVRLLYIHPDNFPLPILDISRRDSRILPYFDIPFQHGSAGTLRAMNRRGSAESYLALIENIRQVLPDAVIRSTFLTGFPGESEEDFRLLLDFQERARLDWAGVFAYSREEDTPAYSMKGRVPRRIAAERKRLIEERQVPISEERMDRFVGRTLDVLAEERIEAEAGPDAAFSGEDIYLGRLFCQAPEVDGAAVISSGFAGGTLKLGTFLRGRVFARAGFDLEVRAL